MNGISTVHGAPPLWILLAIFTLTSSSTSSKYEDPKSVASFRSHRCENSSGSDRYAAREDKADDCADRGYKSYHHLEKTKKKHHDLDNGRGYYGKDGGGKNQHGYNDRRYDEHHEGVDGGKGGEFREKANFGKGQNTLGQHEVKRLVEDRRIKEFHEEDYDSDYNKHDSGFHDEREQGKGGYYKILDYGQHEADHGEEGHHGKRYHHRDHTGRIGSSDHEDHHQND